MKLNECGAAFSANMKTLQTSCEKSSPSKMRINPHEFYSRKLLLKSITINYSVRENEEEFHRPPKLPLTIQAPQARRV